MGYASSNFPTPPRAPTDASASALIYSIGQRHQSINPVRQSMTRPDFVRLEGFVLLTLSEHDRRVRMEV